MRLRCNRLLKRSVLVAIDFRQKPYTHQYIRVGDFDSSATGQEWLRYTGYWGQLGFPIVGGAVVANGPFGPAFQPWWDDDDRMIQ